MLGRKVNDLKDKKKSDSKKIFESICYGLCKTFHWDYHTLMEQPIPFVMVMLTHMMEEAKETRKTMRKAKSRGR